MRATDENPGGSGDEQAAQAPGTAASGRPGMKAVHRPSGQRVRHAAEWGKEKYAGSWAEHLWHRLDAVDFMNQAMLLAATLLLCAVPFLLIAAALSGRSAVSALTWRLGLSKQAAADVGHLFTSSAATSAAVTGLSWVFFILGGIAAATAVQRLYQRVFGLDPRGIPDTLRAVIWLALAVGWIALGGALGPGLRASSPVLWWIVNIPAFIGFWWWPECLAAAGRRAGQAARSGSAARLGWLPQPGGSAGGSCAPPTDHTHLPTASTPRTSRPSGTRAPNRN
jgi:membrane protein